MTIVLLVDGAESCAPQPHRCGWHERAMSRTHGHELDRRLAAGHDPDRDVLLSLRAGWLIGTGTRTRLARRLRGVIRDARLAIHPFDGAVPLARHEILRSRALIEQAAAELERPGPVNARGVALLHLLLTDGSSPLYRPEDNRQLAPQLQRAIDGLDLSVLPV